jgi:hypothetical protein
MFSKEFSKEEFINFIVDGPEATIAKAAKSEDVASALPEGFGDFGFDTDKVESPTEIRSSSFAHNLLIASRFGDPEHIERSEVILNTDAAAKYLPDLVYYWPRTDDRPYQTLLFELEQPGTDILKTSLFKPAAKQQLLEDALSRFLQHTLRGFEKGGEKRTASTRQGKQSETLCIVSVQDDRETENGKVNLVCFGTQNASNGSLESFHINEVAKHWEPKLSNEYLSRLFSRHFKKLSSDKWQNAFISTEERKLAQKLLDTCIDNNATEHDLEHSVVNLLEEIAGSYGLRRKGGKKGSRLKSFALPKDHDIGSDPETRKNLSDQNPFTGMTLRDEQNRLLGYIIYCLDEKQDAEKLRLYLSANNRFHNVLVIYPDGDHASLELWQGKRVLPGKLTKDGAQYTGEGEIVNLLSRFFVVSKAKVKNPTELANELAYRARYLRSIAIEELRIQKDEGALRSLYNDFRDSLVHDQTEEEFADAFAQTLTYGLLTSRWMGSEKLAQNGDRFTRQSALKYLPTTSNFLGELFQSALAVKLDGQRGKLLWLVDDITSLLDRIDISYVFGVGDKNSDKVTDPVIHFYEPFLAAYDSELRNKRGVYFTPTPIVSYIVRSVHKRLQIEFGLKDGLASTDTWNDVQRRFPDVELPVGVESSDPFVCILDPATGTGTFLYESIEIIERTMKKKWCEELEKGSWQDPEIIELWQEYVSNFLIPRLYGYELMMASYAIAHLKITFKLGETGYKLKDHERLHVYLTDSLKPPSDIQTKLPGFTSGLAKESEEVNKIKRKKMFTVVVGNPPYAGHSSNTGDWITRLVHEYYFIDGTPLGERNSKWLQDDYVKFIRLGQKIISQTGTGIHSFITNHGYIDNPTFRGMRQQLIQSFDSIDILDLHGNSTKKETSPDGSEDNNVFDIKQGVAIFLAQRLLNKKATKPSYRHAHFYGLRQQKYTDLLSNTFNNIEMASFSPLSPFYSFLPQNTDVLVEYSEYPSVVEMMPINVLGFQTHRDNFAISFQKDILMERIEKFRDDHLSDNAIKDEYKIKDTKGWSVRSARKLLKKFDNWKQSIITCSYRIFDERYCCFNSIVMDRPRRELIDHVAGRENLCLGVGRQGSAVQDPVWSLAWISRAPVDANIFRRGGINVFPLYLYTKPSSADLMAEKRLNFSSTFLKLLCGKLGLKQKSDFNCPKDISPESIIHYAYAIFYSLNYRNRYAEFLRNDFPRLPLTFQIDLFKELSKLGKSLSDIHLMDSPKLNKIITNYTGPKNKEIKRINWINNTVWIDAPIAKNGQPAKGGTVGFQGVPENVWNFFIGGFQPCEKWLKDRKGLILTDIDIRHYQEMIVAISETIHLQTEIDQVIDKHGGWPNAFVTNKGATP